MSILHHTNHQASNTLRKFVSASTSIVATPTPSPRPKNTERGFPDKTEPAISFLNLGPKLQDVLEQIHSDMSGPTKKATKESLLVFYKQSQGATNIQLEDDKDEYGFGHFLHTISANPTAWDAVAPPVDKDLSKPLTNYFISSSHNTYLDGNQWASKSTPQAYKDVLLRGCRCIEIDVWNGEIDTPRSRSKSSGAGHARNISSNSAAISANSAIDDTSDLNKDESHPITHSRSTSCNTRTLVDEPSPEPSVLLSPEPSQTQGAFLDASHATRRRARGVLPKGLPKGEPIVTHGHTLVSACGFREVCEAIKESAFDGNHNPIIISLEVHADVPQQRVMVEIMKEVWQGLLVDHPELDMDPRFTVPTLEKLQDKILIKVKRNTPSIKSSIGVTTRPAISVEVSDPGRLIRKTLFSSAFRRASAPPASSSHDHAAKDPICEELKALGVYTRSEKFLGFEKPQAKKPAHIFSVSESGILDLNQKQHRAMFLHNKSHFMRAYPNGVRVDSSNPDPSLFWRQGVQMVAMNWQCMDDGMMVNEGMFADEHGWVLKPPGYQSAHSWSKPLGPTTQRTAAQARVLDLNITVFAIQHLPLDSHGEGNDTNRSGSSLRPVVKAKLYVDKPRSGKGWTASKPCCKKQTKAGESPNPDFGSRGESLNWENIPSVVEELSFVR